MDARLNLLGNQVAGQFLKYIISAEKVISDSTLPAATQELVLRQATFASFAARLRAGVREPLLSSVEPCGPPSERRASTAVHAIGVASGRDVTPVRRLAIENLHPDVISAATGLFIDGHYSEAVFNACTALEVRVRSQSGLELSGQDVIT
jgi:hypothetical protein